MPGTQGVKYLEDNVGAARVSLTRGELDEMNRLFPAGVCGRERYSEAMDEPRERVKRRAAIATGAGS